MAAQAMRQQLSTRRPAQAVQAGRGGSLAEGRVESRSPELQNQPFLQEGEQVKGETSKEIVLRFPFSAFSFVPTATSENRGVSGQHRLGLTPGHTGNLRLCTLSSSLMCTAQRIEYSFFVIVR